MRAREDKGLGWKAVYKWNQFSRICNSAAMSWGFAIPPSTDLFVDLSNRITNSYTLGRRIANSPEQGICRAF